MTTKAALVIAIFASSLSDEAHAQGCMEPTDEEGVSVLGFIQPQLEYNERRLDDEFSFTFNRARLGVAGSIPYDVSYYVFAELSPFKPNTPRLLDGFVTYSRLAPHLSVVVGQFKPPFSLELNTSCADLHTIKRSLVVNSLASPDRDLGLMLLGDIRDLVFYSFAVMNGRGSGLMDDNLMKDFVGRVVVTPVKYVSVGVSGRYGISKPLVPSEKDDRTMRIGGELQVRYKDFLLQSEYFYSWERGSYTTGGGCDAPLEIHQGKTRRSGLFVQAMYLLPWDIQPVVKYEFWFPDMKNRKDYLEQITTFGINYFLNDWTRIQLNYRYRAETEEVPNDEVLLQFQAKIG